MCILGINRRLIIRKTKLINRITEDDSLGQPVGAGGDAGGASC